MAVVSGTFETFTAIGIREQLSNVIIWISPEDTPYMSNIGTGEKLTNTYFEWQTDELASAANNRVAEGDDASFSTITPTVRMGSHTQISRKTVIISGTHESTNRAGRKSEMAYQLAKDGAEIKRDMEKMLHGEDAAGEPED